MPGGGSAGATLVLKLLESSVRGNCYWVQLSLRWKAKLGPDAGPDEPIGGWAEPSQGLCAQWTLQVSDYRFMWDLAVTVQGVYHFMRSRQGNYSVIFSLACLMSSRVCFPDMILICPYAPITSIFLKNLQSGFLSVLGCLVGGTWQMCSFRVHLRIHSSSFMLGKGTYWKPAVLHT